MATEAASDGSEGYSLVGFSKFVRRNPRSDRFPIKSFHHVEFWCGDATNTSRRFSFGLGMPLASLSDLSTGNQLHASYLLRSNNLRFLFSAPLSPYLLATTPSDGQPLSTSPTTLPSDGAPLSTSPRTFPSDGQPLSTSATTSASDGHKHSTSMGIPSDGQALSTSATIPSFDPVACRTFSNVHGLGVRAVAVEVDDAITAYKMSISNGARGSFPPKILGDGEAAMAEVELYGDVVLRFISFASPDRSFSFLPGFRDLDREESPPDFGIRRLDHAVGNVPELAPVVAYIKKFLGFHEFAEFSASDVGTAESGLNSVVLANNNENVLLPLNEPVHGTPRRSQIQTFLDHNHGPGLQHLALASDDVIKTLRKMRAVSAMGGFEFLAPPPPTYYRNLRKRASDVLSEEQMKACEELGLLVDRDDQGVLLQIFTKPVGDRPTMFLEIIQRIGCMMKDEKGKEQQKGGCGGFGKGNFTELFRSIEEYEKSLEIKQATSAATRSSSS
ncbi:4-hydroxyphenylpyruvate dioxygenase [Wolffia australiana]